MDNTKETIMEILKTIKRNGIDKVIEFLEKRTYFTDPASANYHGNFEGGLAAHSLAVYEELVKLTNRDDDSVKIVGLLHDICKVGTYEIDFKNVKNEEGKWEKVPFYKNKSNGFPFGHGEKSVLMLLKLGLELTTEEMVAIRFHMGPYESKEIWATIEEAQKQYPLAMYMHFADIIASRFKA